MWLVIRGPDVVVTPMGQGPSTGCAWQREGAVSLPPEFAASMDRRRVCNADRSGRLVDLHVLLSDVEARWRSRRSTRWKSVK